MPFTYVSSKSKKKVRFEKFMSCYGRGQNSDDDLMTETEMAARIESLAQTHGGTLTKKGE